MGMGFAQHHALVACLIAPRVIEVRLGPSMVIGEHTGGSDRASNTGNGHRRRKVGVRDAPSKDFATPCPPVGRSGADPCGHDSPSQ